MHALPKVLCAVFLVFTLVACGNTRVLGPGQSFALAPDLSISLLSSRPTLTQLRLEVTVTPTGATPLAALVPSVVVIPDGGRELSASLDFRRDNALITMLLEDAQHVEAVTVRDARSGHSADWSTAAAQTVLGCKPGDECQLIGIPRAPSLPGRP